MSPSVVLLLGVGIVLSGCFSVKPSSAKSGKKLFDTFFVGEEGTQYFIKPLLLESVTSDEKLHIDFTFRYKDQVKDSSTVNISIQSPHLYKSLDGLQIANATAHIAASEPTLLFNEKSGQVFVSRFTTKISLQDTEKMFNGGGDWTIVASHPSQKTTYKATAKTAKAVAILRDKIFVLM